MAEQANLERQILSQVGHWCSSLVDSWLGGCEENYLPFRLLLASATSYLVSSVFRAASWVSLSHLFLSAALSSHVFVLMPAEDSRCLSWPVFWACFCSTCPCSVLNRAQLLAIMCPPFAWCGLPTVAATVGCSDGSLVNESALLGELWEPTNLAERFGKSVAGKALFRNRLDKFHIDNIDNLNTPQHIVQ